jgi:hypothetical protein
MPSTPGWVNILSGGVPGAIAAYNFQTGQYWMQGNPSGGIFANSPAQYVAFADKHVAPVAANNLPISDLGLADWESSSNLVAYPNDFTNVAWTTTNMTAALNATGPDLVLNSASTLTATAGNATVKQAITQASTNEQASIFIKAGTVTGAVQMTIDNGATWTPVTVGTNWSQVSIPQQTLANPTFGLRIVNNGDSVQVWCAQVEPGLIGSGPTAPMPTGYSPRTANGVGAIVPIFPGQTATFLVKTAPMQSVTGSIGFLANHFLARGVTATTVKNTADDSTVLTATAGSGSLTVGNSKICLGLDANGRSLCFNGGTVVSDAHTILVGGILFTINSGPADGPKLSCVIWPSRLPDATLKTLSTLP